MKKAASALPIVFTALYSIVPACALAAQLSGYSFSLRNYAGGAAFLALLACFACLMIFIAFIFSDFGARTTVEYLESPRGAYAVEVISADQGALGGGTFIDIRYLKSGVDLYILKFSKPPKRIYQGEWDAHKRMKLYWADESTLMINSAPYYVE